MINEPKSYSNPKLDKRPLKKLKIVFDTNNLNAYKNNSDLNFIESLEKEEYIEIFFGGDTFIDLLKDKSQNPLRFKKFESKELVLSTIRLNYSILGKCVLSNGEKPFLDDSLARLIFGREWKELNRNSKIDIKLLEASIMKGIDLFVTQDSKIIEKSPELLAKYKLKIVSRSECVDFLKIYFSGYYNANDIYLRWLKQ